MIADQIQHNATLAWPPGRPRHYPDAGLWAPWRADGQPITLPRALERLTNQLRLLDARTPVLSTNVTLRRDGKPHNDTKPRDPGAALYFTLTGQPIVLACDRWHTVAGNVAALASHIQALRAMDRWGVGTIEQAFAGYAALPAPPARGSSDAWRGVLDNPSTLTEAEAVYRAKMRTAHPDAGGSHTRAALLNVAIDRARQEMK